MCLTKIPVQSMFKLLPVIYFQNMCIVICVFSCKNERIALFSKHFGIVVSGFSY